MVSASWPHGLGSDVGRVTETDRSLGLIHVYVCGVHFKQG